MGIIKKVSEDELTEIIGLLVKRNRDLLYKGKLTSIVKQRLERKGQGY